jgi:uncharacterized protein (DUF1015 family)
VSVTDGSVKIHEAVSAEGAENTRRRFELSQADLTPIFIGIEQNQNFALPELLKSLLPAAEKILRFEEQGLSSHTLWRLSSGFEQIQAQFSARELFLLDGHHRFRGAQENFARGLGDGRLLACVTTISPEEVLILAIHRAIICEPWLLPESAVVSIEALGCRIVERVRWSRERLEDIVHDTDWTKGDFYLLPTQSAELFLMKLPEQKKPALVVDRIENEILSKIREANSLPANDLLFLVDQLASGQAQAAILLPPLTGADVLSAARANSVLPRKSTQFYPKPALGLICRPWD